MTDRYGTFTIADDGEPGTNLVCDACGLRVRYDFDGTTEVSAEAIEDEYQAWVAWLLVKTNNDHEEYGCPKLGEGAAREGA